MSKELKACLLLFLTAAIWGMAFAMQTLGLENIDPFTFSTARSFVGALFLLFIHQLSKGPLGFLYSQGDLRSTVKGGVICGIFLCVGINLQQVALMYTTAGKAGFITTLYIVMVPIIGIFFRQRIDLKTSICVLFAVIGLYFLCVKEDFSVNFGDFLVFISAIFFSFHIIAISIYIKNSNAILMSSVQLFVVGIISTALMLVFEDFELMSLKLAILPVLYVGIMSSGVAFTLQIYGLRFLNPTIASLITSVESVFASVFGLFLLGQIMTNREIMGASIMFVATILAQIPIKKRRSRVR